MKKIWIAYIMLFWAANMEAQNYYSSEDSILQTTHLSGQDWMIALTVETHGSYMVFDSTGKQTGSDPQGSYILSKINGQYQLQQWTQASYGDPLRLLQTKMIDPHATRLCNNTIDSILQADNEFIFPYIYFNDSINAYLVNHSPTHAPTFSISFKAVNFYKSHLIDEVQVYQHPFFRQFVSENLNDSHNKSTFLYRSFMAMIRLIRQQFNIQQLNYE